MRVDIVFAKTRYHYDSYVDFWTLVELSGFETCYVDEIDIAKPRVYIVTPMNGEWVPHIDNQAGKLHNAHLVHWCLERPSGSGSVYNYAKSNRAYLYARQLDDVWVSDRGLASETMFRFVVLGSNHGLGEPGGNKLYDIVHMSYITDRRARIYNEVVERGGTVAPNSWPWENRDALMKASRFALNVHKDSYPFQEPLRLALFAAYGLPILTEAMNDAWPWNEDVCVFRGYDGIVGNLFQMIGNPYQRWKEMGLQARDYMCNIHNFRKMVLAGVRDSLEPR